MSGFCQLCGRSSITKLCALCQSATKAACRHCSQELDVDALRAENAGLKSELAWAKSAVADLEGRELALKVEVERLRKVGNSFAANLLNNSVEHWKARAEKAEAQRALLLGTGPETRRNLFAALKKAESRAEKAEAEVERLHAVVQHKDQGIAFNVQRAENLEIRCRQLDVSVKSYIQQLGAKTRSEARLEVANQALRNRVEELETLLEIALSGNPRNWPAEEVAYRWGWQSARANGAQLLPSWSYRWQWEKGPPWGPPESRKEPAPCPIVEAIERDKERGIP